MRRGRRCGRKVGKMVWRTVWVGDGMVMMVGIRVVVGVGRGTEVEFGGRLVVPSLVWMSVLVVVGIVWLMGERIVQIITGRHWLARRVCVCGIRVRYTRSPTGTVGGTEELVVGVPIMCRTSILVVVPPLVWPIDSGRTAAAMTEPSLAPSPSVSPISASSSVWVWGEARWRWSSQLRARLGGPSIVVGS